MAIPVISVESMRAWERATWDAGIAEEAVIDRVGKAIANWIQPRLRDDSHLLILAGRGNNGADGKAAARHLPPQTARLLEVSDPARARESLCEALMQHPQFILDSLFGIGLNRALSKDWCVFMDIINQSSTSIISVDVPSGLDAETGEARGNAICAETTLTIGAPKSGMLQSSAAQYVGYIRVLNDVGLAAMPSGDVLYFGENSDFVSFPPSRRAIDSKAHLGHLGILAGSEGYHGAAILAARAAMRACPGRITLETLPEVYLPIAAQLQQVMTRIWKPENQLAQQSSAVLMGPGLASKSAKTIMGEALIQHWQQADCPVIADASALDLIPKGKIKMKFPRIITPHSGEAARLLDCHSSDIEKQRLQSLRALSCAYGDCWVILKGTHTLIGRNQGRVLVNATGDPGLAQGGSGDVLAGMIAGLLANPNLQTNVERLLQFAVWQHGKAAETLSQKRTNWIVEELPEAIAFS